MKTTYIEGKELTLKHHEKVQNVMIPSTNENVVLQPLFTTDKIVLYLREDDEEEDKKRAGHLKFHFHTSYQPHSKKYDGVHLWEIYVEPEYRRRGIGSFLLEYALRVIDFRLDVPVTVIAQTYDTDMNNETLSMWYARFGFKRVHKGEENVSEKAKEWIEKGTIFMERPRSSSVNDERGYTNNNLEYFRLFRHRDCLFEENYDYSTKNVAKRTCLGSKIQEFLRERSKVDGAKRRREESAEVESCKQNKKFQ